MLLEPMFLVCMTGATNYTVEICVNRLRLQSLLSTSTFS